MNLQDRNGVSALAGHMEIVKLLISRGAKVNPEHGNSPLLLASAEGPTEIVKFLLEQGAVVNVQNVYAVHVCSIRSK